LSGLFDQLHELAPSAALYQTDGVL